MAEQNLSFEQWLANAPAERRGVIEQVWKFVRERMPAGYTEAHTPKFLTYKAGDEWYVALANQKNYISLHLVPLYVFPELKAKLDASEKKVKCGKGCINFLRAEELPLETIGEIVGAYGAEEFKQHVQRNKSAAKKAR